VLADEGVQPFAAAPGQGHAPWQCRLPSRWMISTKRGRSDVSSGALEALFGVTGPRWIERIEVPEFLDVGGGWNAQKGGFAAAGKAIAWHRLSDRQQGAMCTIPRVCVECAIPGAAKPSVQRITSICSTRATLADRARTEKAGFGAPYDALVMPTTSNTPPPGSRDLRRRQGVRPGRESTRACAIARLINMIDGCWRDFAPRTSRRGRKCRLGLMLAASGGSDRRMSSNSPAGNGGRHSCFDLTFTIDEFTARPTPLTLADRSGRRRRL